MAIRIREAMELRQMRQVDLAKATGIGKSSISTYLKGEYRPNQIGIYKIAKALNVSEAWLMGFDVPMHRISDYERQHPEGTPLLGVIHCGEPVLCEENIEGYILVPDNIRCDYALRCKGDSMIDEGICDGDLVYIRQQQDAENGDIVAALIDGETTLKKFYRSGDTITLLPANNKYAPIVLTMEAAAALVVIGKAVGYTHHIVK